MEDTEDVYRRQPTQQHLWREVEVKDPDADRQYEPFCEDENADTYVPATTEESNAIPVCAPCHKRAMHFVSDFRHEAKRKSINLTLAASSAAIVNAASGNNIHSGLIKAAKEVAAFLRGEDGS